MQLRASNLQRLRSRAFDVLVVGGGINGAVAAAALASKGAQVGLVDRGDFAGFTSQESSNLAWGGIKYMETYEFPLVRDLCMARNRLMRSYPSTVQEIRFLTAVPRGFRFPPWVLWAGTWLYWLTGNCFTRPPRLPSRREVEREVPVVDGSAAAGFVEYSDAYLYDNDARFVFNFVRTALNRGAAAANYVESLGARREDGWWWTRLRDTVGDSEFEVRSRVLVNAAGAFADDYNHMCGVRTRHRHVLSKGVHLLVDRIVPDSRVLAFFADDGRLFFAIPMGARTCLGTTDTRVDSPFTEVTDEDRRFVLDNINRRLRLARPLTTGDIVAERCGVRPLAVTGESDAADDFMQLSRKHAIDVDEDARHLSVFGGKLTDCVNVGDEICDIARGLGVDLPYPHYRWFGEPQGSVREEYFHQARLMRLDEHTAAHCSEPLSTRLWRRYGAHAFTLLERIREDPRQAEILIEGTEYTRCEIRQAARREMIVKLDDFLRRRSKIALMMRREEIRAAGGLAEACEILFGDGARARMDEYFARNE